MRLQYSPSSPVYSPASPMELGGDVAGPSSAPLVAGYGSDSDDGKKQKKKKKKDKKEKKAKKNKKQDD